MDRNKVLAMLREAQEANEGASKAIDDARVISGRQQAKVDEAAWLDSIKEDKENEVPRYDGGFFVMNTDRIIR